ncbi:uncharacterized protein LOC135930024 isoform X2 [Gordionus sp. m RMFG-2023]|uniref:uncharacterized protein LOC135930024 isoform X2 n=1 Tax=Gordionus sp. m RMFG-2023 TaxID=3053472 RepID=UPI0031FC5BE7
MGNSQVIAKNYSYNLNEDGIIKVSEDIAENLMSKGINVNSKNVYSSNNTDKVINQDIDKYKSQLKKHEEYITFLEEKLRGENKKNVAPNNKHQHHNNKILTAEAFDNLLKKFYENYSPHSSVKHCEIEKNIISECYKINENKILQCSREAKKFENCVLNIQQT